MASGRLKTVSGALALASFAGAFFLFRPVAGAWLKLPIPALAFSGLPSSLSGVQVAPYKEDPTLIIPKLGVSAPIVKGVPLADQGDYDKALESGVALAQGTAGLEASSGNSFIFGHSSAPAGFSGGYDTVFAALPSVQAGDEIQVSVGGRLSSYKVVTSKSIDATDVQYLASGSQKQLTLLTCWPPGTSYKRWVVQAGKEL